MPGLKEAIEKIQDTVIDFTSLQVSTYLSTDLQLTVDGQFKSNFEEFLKTGITSGKLQLVSLTRVDLDGDIINLLTPGFEDHSITKFHSEQLKLAFGIRNNLIEFLRGLL